LKKSRIFNEGRFEMNETFEKLANVQTAGNKDEVVQLTQECIDKGSIPCEILDKELLAGMDELGRRFQA
jgi:methanogenic corrinoid protein MtbC1